MKWDSVFQSLPSNPPSRALATCAIDSRTFQALPVISQSIHIKLYFQSSSLSLLQEKMEWGHCPRTVVTGVEGWQRMESERTALRNLFSFPL